MSFPGLVDKSASLLNMDSSLLLTQWHNFFAIYAFSLFFITSNKLGPRKEKLVKIIEVLEEAAKRVHKNVKHLAGTKESGTDHGMGAGGDISRRIDIVAEKTVLDYLREINFECTVFGEEDRKSTRLNSSHPSISYAVFC